ncbi:MAG: type IV secretion system DNA-binding domain-containing protein [Acidobacteriaceae bacterium]
MKLFNRNGNPGKPGTPAATSPRVMIGGVPMPQEIEARHTLLSGAIGSGKTSVMDAFIATARERGERAAIVDPGGEFMARYFRDGDVILNPLDVRNMPWSPFSEIHGIADVERIAKSLIPDIEGDPASQQWQFFSQKLVSAIMRRLLERGDRDNGTLVYNLSVAGKEELGRLVAGLPASRLFGEGADRMLASVLGVVGTTVDTLSFLSPDADHTSWSIAQWVEKGEGWLWFPYLFRDRALLASLISAQIGELVSAILSLRPDRKRRLWLFMDELAALGRVQGLGDALAQGRKFGLAVVAAIQTVAQPRTSFGEHSAQTLLSCFSNKLILRADDPDTADWGSRLLGDRQILRRVQSEGSGAGGAHSGESEQIAIERAVLPSEVSHLPDLRGYLRFTGGHPIALVEIEIPEERPEVCPPFMPAGSNASADPTPALPGEAKAPTETEPQPARDDLSDLLSGRLRGD